MSSKTKSYAIAMMVSVGALSLDTLGLVEFGAFASGLALLVVVFAVLVLAAIVRDRKTNDG